MAQAKKAPSEAQIAARKKFGEAAKARAAARQNKNSETKIETSAETAQVLEQPEISPGQTISTSEYDLLKREIEELKNNQFTELIKALRGEDQGQASTAGGKLTGTFEKYSTSKDRYPDPTDRLSGESRLARFAFPMNYELNFNVGVSEYTTIDNIRTKEPKFYLELVRIMMDEDTGEPTNGRYVICNFIMHEDPEAALVIASDNGLEIEEDDEETFLNEMRYLRMRDWLLECFYPAPPSKKHDRKDMVIDGKLVSYFEVNNEQGKGLGKPDWDNLPRIKF